MESVTIQTELFASIRQMAQHETLREHYAGHYVAMRDGKVLDHDPDIATLYHRIHQQYGDAPILIAPVTEHPMPIYEMRSPRLVRVVHE